MPTFAETSVPVDKRHLHSALGYLSPARFEQINRPRGVKKVA